MNERGEFNEVGPENPKDEPGEKITKESVINAYRRFVEAGITNTDDLDLNDPDVQKAHNLFYQWQKQEDVRVSRNEELQKQIHLAKTMLYVDAGFTDPEYLDEVLNDWLIQDSVNAEKQADNPERIETRRQIATAIFKIRSILEKQAREIPVPSPEEKTRQIKEKQMQELARRREAGELEPFDYEIVNLWHLKQSGEPVTSKDVKKRAIVIRPDEFEVFLTLDFINASGERIILDLTEENFDRENPLIIFPEELGEELDK